jgi:hypothetical protein
VAVSIAAATGIEAGERLASQSAMRFLGQVVEVYLVYQPPDGGLDFVALVSGVETI